MRMYGRKIRIVYRRIEATFCFLHSKCSKWEAPDSPHVHGKSFTCRAVPMSANALR